MIADPFSVPKCHFPNLLKISAFLLLGCFIELTFENSGNNVRRFCSAKQIFGGIHSFVAFAKRAGYKLLKAKGCCNETNCLIRPLSDSILTKLLKDYLHFRTERSDRKN